MHEVLVNRLGGLSLPRKNVVRLIDRPGMYLDVYRGLKTTMQQQQQQQFFTCIRNKVDSVPLAYARMDQSGTISLGLRK